MQQFFFPITVPTFDRKSEDFVTWPTRPGSVRFVALPVVLPEDVALPTTAFPMTA